MDQIVLYGCGGVCRQVLPMLAKDNEIKAIIDRNSDLWGGSWMGFRLSD